MARIIRISGRRLWRVLVTFIVLIVAFELFLLVSPGGHARRESEPELEADPVAADSAASPAGPVELLQAVVCLDVYENRPQLVKDHFNQNVDYLCCFTRLSTPGKPVTIIHRWRINGQPDFEKKMVVQGRGCSVWSRRSIFAKLPGEGRVEIVLENGNILGAAVFTLL
jgi:hypothetical protein